MLQTLPKISALPNKCFSTFLNRNLGWTIQENTYLFEKYYLTTHSPTSAQISG